jgi:hypothetical protein
VRASVRMREAVRPKDLGTLDRSRGGLILARRVKATPVPITDPDCTEGQRPEDQNRYGNTKR